MLAFVPGGKDTAKQKTVPFICVISDDEEEIPVKVEPKVEPQSHDTPVVPVKTEPLPQTPVETVKAKDVEEDIKVEPISLEVESAREDFKDSEKVSERENMLMMQVKNLAKGLEEMKNQMKREKIASAKKNFAAKLHHKLC